VSGRKFRLKILRKENVSNKIIKESLEAMKKACKSYFRITLVKGFVMGLATIPFRMVFYAVRKSVGKFEAVIYG